MLNELQILGIIGLLLCVLIIQSIGAICIMKGLYVRQYIIIQQLHELQNIFRHLLKYTPPNKE